jgi:O-antigen ligase
MTDSVRTSPRWTIAGLFIVFLSVGVASSWLTESFGLKGTAIFPALLLSSLVVPALRREGLARLRVLRKQISWWHTLWLLVFASALVFRIRDTQDISHSALDFWALYRIGLMAIAGATLIIRLAIKTPVFSMTLFHGLLGRLLVYALICVLSTTWSAYRAWTFYKSIEYLIVVVLLAVIVATCGSLSHYKQLLDFTWTIDGLLLLSIWVGALLWPADAFQRAAGVIGVQLQGVSPIVADNGVGHVSAILAVVALSRFLRKPQRRSSRIFYLTLFGITVITMALAQTRSAILGFLLGISLLLYFSKRIGAIAGLFFVVLLLFLATGAGSFFEQYMRRGQNADQVASLSGRTDWWELGWTEFTKRPWTGMGAFTARFTVLAKVGDQQVSTVHNTYLEAALGGGIIGLLALLATVVGVWTSLLREIRRPVFDPARRQLALEVIAVLGVITARSFFSVGFVVHYDIDFMALVGFAEFSRRFAEPATALTNNRGQRPGHLLYGRSNPAVIPCLDTPR